MECLRNNFYNGVVLGGRYKTLSPLNHGSFGMVFTARDMKTNDIVAIKCMTKKSATNDTVLGFSVDDKSEELYCHEQLANHPNVVNLLDSFETDSHQYLVLEFCSRGDLYEAIRTGYGPLETEHVRHFMLELVDAVAFMHSKNIFHRDIKPENIFLTESGTMKLGDFGLATTDVWSHEATVGSDRYMAPEQYDSAGEGYSPAQADIWAIGICLLNILFSRNPFTVPTEADPLFLDFSRDKQSLFDVFPTMSQDTYEVIVECMNLDPRKRSLVGAKAALKRIISFTTEEEENDDFCCGDIRPTATANREPLRTPSIQSPHIEQGAFPWAKALHTSPHKTLRQLSSIPDNESYSEELFPKSEGTMDWMSSFQTPSIASVLTSNLGISMNSVARPVEVPARFGTKAPTMAGSLPIKMNRPKANLGAMSMVFGRKKDTISKSWSDMWEEDEEEDEEEQARQLQELKNLNAKTWARQDENSTPTLRAQVPEPNINDTENQKLEVSPVEGAFTIGGDIDGDLVADGFFFHDHASPKKPDAGSSRYSPPPKRTVVDKDKWAALGERRRAFTGSSDKTSPMAKPYHTASGSNNLPSHNSAFHNFASHGFGTGVTDNGHMNNQNTPHTLKWNKIPNFSRDRPWNRGRDWNWRQEKRHDLDLGWVGNWQVAH